MNLHRDPCPECGRKPGPYLVLRGWHPCLCGGHSTRRCRDDNGGCGYVLYDPPLVEGRCREPAQGFTPPRS